MELKYACIEFLCDLSNSVSGSPGLVITNYLICFKILKRCTEQQTYSFTSFSLDTSQLDYETPKMFNPWKHCQYASLFHFRPPCHFVFNRPNRLRFVLPISSHVTILLGSFRIILLFVFMAQLCMTQNMLEK